MIRSMTRLNKWVFTFLIITVMASSQAKPNKLMGELAEKNAYKFLAFIAEGNVVEAHKMLDRSFSVEQGGSASFKNLTEIKPFTAYFDQIFNQAFREVLAKNLLKELNVSGAEWYGRSQWNVRWEDGSKYEQYRVVFNESGRPIGVSNPTMIAPSFNCLLARSITEKALCSNRTIAKLDVQVAMHYKHARKYLTGEEFKSLKTQQRAFNRSRDKCEGAVDCLEIALKKRSSQLTQLIDAELTKSPLSFDSEKQKYFSGQWSKSHWLDASHCESDSERERKTNTRIDMIIDFPKVSITKKDETGEQVYECETHYTSSFTYKKIESLHSDLFDFGTCRGSFDRLQYEGHYIYIPLKDVAHAPNKNACKDHVMIISGRQGHFQLLFNDSSQFVNKNGLLSSGYRMIKAADH